MKSKIIHTLILISLAFFAASEALAATRLSVQPITGGSTLYLGQSRGAHTFSKEVRVRITNSSSDGYQVFQRLIEPLRNQTNRSLQPNAVNVYSIFGSNSSGTLYANHPEYVSQSDQLIYTSAPNGVSDSFTLVYTVDQNFINESGEFFGRLQFTVRPLGSGQQETVYLNIRLDAKDVFELDIKTSSGSDSIRLNPKNKVTSEGYAEFAFDGSFNQDIRIYQEMSGYFQNSKGDVLEGDVIKFRTSSLNPSDSQISSFTNLTPKRTLIYSNAVSKDTFYVNYVLNHDKINDHSAGNYRGALFFIIERNGRQTRRQVDVEVDIEPVFKMDVELPPGGISFPNILPDSPPIVHEVTVNINSNTGRPYIIMQNMPTLLVNQKGEKIEQQYFTHKITLLNDAKGKPEVSEYEPVQAGNYPIFYSDEKGSSASFKVFYRLRSYPNILAGDYSTQIRYSLEEK